MSAFGCPHCEGYDVAPDPAETHRELLAALSDLVEYYGPFPDVDNGLDERLTIARAAIARATY